MKCLVITPEKTVLEMDVASLVLPLFDGELGVLPGHSPIIARLGAGELRVKPLHGKIIHFYIEGGFVEILHDVVALLTLHAQPAHEMDIAHEEQQFADALSSPGHTAVLAQIKEAKVHSRRNRLRTAKKHGQ